MNHKIFFLLVLFIQPAFSHVDIQTGSFRHNAIDYRGGDLDLAVSLNRTYSSRSKHEGWFGLGWCSPFERRVQADGDRIYLQACGDVTKKELKKNGKQYVLNDSTFKKIGSSWDRTLSDGTQERYDSEGRLIEIRNGSGVLKISFKSHLPTITDGSGNTVALLGQKYIERISLKNGEKETIVSEYKYRDNNLISAKNSWGNTYKYEYQDSNLSKIIWPDYSYVEVSYTANDWVKGLSGSSICKESYDYQVKDYKYEVDITRDCKGKVSSEKVVIEEVEKRILATTVQDANGDRTFTYDDDGRIIEVATNIKGSPIVKKIHRDHMGFINLIEDSNEERHYKYSNLKIGYRLSELTIVSKFEDRVVSTEIYKFTYDSSGRVSSIIKPEGKISFFYHSSGKLKEIISGKESVRLIYNDKDGFDLSGAGQTVNLNDHRYMLDAKKRRLAELYFEFVGLYNLAVPTI